MKFLIAAHNNAGQITWPMHLVQYLGLQEGYYRRRLYDRKILKFEDNRPSIGKLGRNQKNSQWTLSGMTKLRERANALVKADVDTFLCWVEQPNTICFALPRWDADDELARLHLVAWDFIVERAIRKESTADEELFHKLNATAPKHFLYGYDTMNVFWRNIDQRCVELGIPSLKVWRAEASPPKNSRPAWPETALNPFKDEEQAIASYCEQQGLTPDQRQVIEKLEKFIQVLLLSFLRGVQFKRIFGPRFYLRLIANAHFATLRLKKVWKRRTSSLGLSATMTRNEEIQPMASSCAPRITACSIVVG